MKLRQPKSWGDLKIEEWKELRFLSIEEFDSITDFDIERFSILLDIDSGDEYWNSITADRMDELRDEFSFIDKLPREKVAEQIGELYFKGFDNMTLAEYIDLDFWFNKDFIENIERIASILYRKEQLGEWGEKVIEPYNKYNRKERAKSLEGLPIEKIYGVLPKFLRFRENFIETYDGLFDTGEEDTIEEEQEQDEIVTIEGQKQKQEEKTQRYWVWEKLIFEICGKDVTKYEQVINLPLIFVFNTLSMQQDFKNI